MKLQDYLHYYIGCDYWTDNSEGEVNAETIRYIKPMIDKGYNVRLQLRRLSDISNNEAIAIASMAMFDKMPGYPISDYMVSKRGMGQYPATACQIAINNDWWDLEIAIGFNTGNIWYCKGDLRVFNQPIIFHTLLTQHFDLFGLIDAGLAIDAKTIKP